MNSDSFFTKAKEKISWFFGTRILPLGVVVAVLIYVLFVNMYNIQILQSLDPAVTVAARSENRVRTIYVDAPRGNIYDRYGRPLALNVPVDIIRINPAEMSRPSDVLITSIIEFVRLANLFGDEVINPQTIRITEQAPYEFTTTSLAVLRGWLLDVSVIYTDMPRTPNHEDARFFLSSSAQELEDIFDIDPEYVLSRLNSYFRLPEELPQGVCRRLVIEISAAVYMERYFFNQITIARNISPRLAVAIEERGDIIPNFYSDVEFLRIYPGGQYVSHLIGYIRPASESDMEQFGGSGRYGLRSTDMFGSRGVERAFQMSGDIGGVRGIREVEIDPSGRRVSNTITTPATPGNDIFLTIDLQLQQTAVQSMERVLSEHLAARIRGASVQDAELPVPPSAVISGIIRTNNVSIQEIMQAESGRMLTVRNHIEAAQRAAANELLRRATYYPDFYVHETEVNPLETFTQMREFLAAEVYEHRVSVALMIGILYEQGVLSMTTAELNQLNVGTLHIPRFLSDRVLAGEITPRMAMVRPYYASVVVTNIHTGAIYVAANYPNFDNNAFVYPIDTEYRARANADPSAPLMNRVFQTNRMPGSTFKMITAVAGLEEGVISPTGILHCRGFFTRAGTPYIRCWTVHMVGAHHTHGWLNVRRAISESCNYFFFETMWLLGNTAAERTAVLNEWMRRFGLDTPSGVEIGNIPTRLSSPEMQRFGAPPWNNRDAVATSIGQSLNNYNTVVMAKYVATLVNGGYRFQSHLLHRIADNTGVTIRYFEPVLEEIVGISPQNHQVIMNGMYDVFYGGGTGDRGMFNNFPITIGGKTGTAQNGTPHSDESLAIFAPFHNPEIAIYIMIPFGDTRHYSQPTMRIAQDILACFFRVEWSLAEDTHSSAPPASQNNILTQ